MAHQSDLRISPLESPPLNEQNTRARTPEALARLSLEDAQWELDLFGIAPQPTEFRVRKTVREAEKETERESESIATEREKQELVVAAPPIHIGKKKAEPEGRRASIRVLIADDHRMFVDLLQYTLAIHPEQYTVVGLANDGKAALKLTLSHGPDLLLLAYEMPKLGRLTFFCQELLQQRPKTRILVIGSQPAEEYAMAAAASGAHGYISKAAPVADLCTAITVLNAGGIWADSHLPPRVFQRFLQCKNETAQNLKKLSRQELTVLTLLTQGMSNQQMSQRLHISPKTVKNHLTHIFAKLRASNRKALLRVLV